MTPRRVDTGTLELGAGLETLIQAALESVPVGGEIDVATVSRTVALEIPAWARIAGHETTAEAAEGRGPETALSRAGASRAHPPRARTRPAGTCRVAGDARGDAAPR